ncbi:MAG: hypothetical protein AAF490_24835 [Chloroflexota bacterium]
MKDKRLLGCLLIPILLIFCGISAVPALLYQQTPKLTQYNDTRLLDQNTQFVFLRNICISTFYFTQEYQAAITGEDVWDRLSEQWDVRPDTFFKTGNEAFSEKELYGNLDLTSNVLSYDIDQTTSIIVVSNQFVYKFPKRMCDPFG